MPKYTLTYIDFGGRAEAIRLAFTLGKIQFTDIRLSMEEFGKQKQEGKFKFSQIPVLDIDGNQYAQSKAILKYIGKISGLYPQTDIEQLLVDEGVDHIDDVITKIAYAVFHAKESEQKQERQKLQNEILPHMLSYYDKQVQLNKSGYYADQLTVADLYCYVALRWITSGAIDHFSYNLNQHKGLVQLVKQIEEIPEVQKWNAIHQ